MTRIIRESWFCRCEKCDKMFYLPGVVPDESMLKRTDWKYCPYCGEQIEYTDKEEEPYEDE